MMPQAAAAAVNGTYTAAQVSTNTDPRRRQLWQP